jgi:signal transduction histidine kinase
MSVAPDKTKNTQTPMPPALNGVFIFFSILTWLILFFCTGITLANTTDGNYFYLIPVALYALHFQVYPGVRYLRGIGWQWRNVSRRMAYDPVSPWRGPIFVLIEFLLVLWMYQCSPGFFSMCFVLFGHTLGILRWKFGLPMVALEIFSILVQDGLFAETSRLGSDGLASVILAFVFALPNTIIIGVLITSRFRSEALVQELKATKQRLEEALMKEKEIAVLRERDRMAREMHDVLGHALVLVAVKIEAAQRLQTIDPVRAAHELDATKELVRQSMADLRASLADLRSPALEADDKPLAEALKTWAEMTSKEGPFEIECNFETDTTNWPVPVQDAFWRVGREAILNVVKHARAKKVELKVFCKDNTAFLSVSDDGVGIPHLAEGTARLEVEGHYGVRGMRERLETLGGKLVISPNHHKGTLVLASVPLPSPEEAPAERIRKRLNPVKNWLLREG